MYNIDSYLIMDINFVVAVKLFSGFGSSHIFAMMDKSAL